MKSYYSKKDARSLVFLTFIFFAFISLMLGYNADDYLWGGNRHVIKYLTSPMFTNYDGRYLGNSLAIAGFQYPILAALIFGLTMSIIIWTFYWLSKRLDVTLIGFIILMLMPSAVFSQTIGWKAGFYNYVLSIVPIVLLLKVAENRIILKAISKPNLFELVLMPILLFLGSFLSEPITLLLVVNEFVLLIVAKKENGSIPREFIYYLIVNLLGLVLMLSNRGYWSGNNVHQFTPGANIIEITKMISSFHVLILFFSIAVSLYIYNFYKDKNSKLKKIMILPVIYLLCLILNKFFQVSKLMAILSLLVLVLSTLLLAINYKNLSSYGFWICLFLILNAFGSLVPYIVVSPFGPRGAIAYYVFMTMAGVYIVSCVLPLKKSITVISIILSLICVTYYSYIGIQVNAAKTRNSTLIEYQMKNKTYETNNDFYYIQIPYTNYWWNPRPQYKDEMLMTFYAIPKETNGKLIPWNTKVLEISKYNGKNLFEYSKKIK